MFRTIEAVIDENGAVRLLEPIPLPGTMRALVTIMDTEAPFTKPTHLGEAMLSDWDRPEEDQAWDYLQNP